MVQHPIYVRRTNYRGSDKKKLAKVVEMNRVAAELERHINEMLLEQKEPIKSYLWHEISVRTGYSFELVSRLGFAIDGGSNGFTAIRYDMTYEQAIAANKLG